MSGGYDWRSHPTATHRSNRSATLADVSDSRRSLASSCPRRAARAYQISAAPTSRSRSAPRPSSSIDASCGALRCGGRSHTRGKSTIVSHTIASRQWGKSAIVMRNVWLDNILCVFWRHGKSTVGTLFFILCLASHLNHRVPGAWRPRAAA